MEEENQRIREEIESMERRWSMQGQDHRDTSTASFSSRSDSDP